MKNKKKKNNNKGAHKEWTAEAMSPDHFGHDHRKWRFWSGKLGWEGFPKSSWEWLKELKNTAKAAEQLDGTEIGDGDLIEKCCYFVRGPWHGARRTC